ncbi:hypothetical protein Q8A67_016622 [Cirrhinus molitorella]|uniref:Uncharacterized protein n=1 Tax=Cirrhinus molitorella TaxID=172907 RepID=A0AA88PD92_9TELE|nr:hypothetical protein Q8A67_016622 [Cirrhinus molitorella]
MSVQDLFGDTPLVMGNVDSEEALWCGVLRAGAHKSSHADLLTTDQAVPRHAQRGLILKGYFEKRGQARLDGVFDECRCIFEKARDALLSPAEGILGHMVTYGRDSPVEQFLNLFHYATCNGICLMEGFQCGLSEDLRFVMPSVDCCWSLGAFINPPQTESFCPPREWPTKASEPNPQSESDQGCELPTAVLEGVSVEIDSEED